MFQAGREHLPTCQKHQRGLLRLRSPERLFAAILNTPRAKSEWSLDLGGEIKLRGNRVERGAGNIVSAEFAVLYHWHAALSAADGQWMEDMIRSNLPELETLEEMTPELFGKILKQEGHKLKTIPPHEWPFSGLKRALDGSFNDADLGKIIKDCIEEPAHAFGAHGAPARSWISFASSKQEAFSMFAVSTSELKPLLGASALLRETS